MLNAMLCCQQGSHSAANGQHNQVRLVVPQQRSRGPTVLSIVRCRSTVPCWQPFLNPFTSCSLCKASMRTRVCASCKVQSLKCPKGAYSRSCPSNIQGAHQHALAGRQLGLQHNNSWLTALVPSTGLLMLASQGELVLFGWCRLCAVTACNHYLHCMVHAGMGKAETLHCIQLPTATACGRLGNCFRRTS